jgi:glycosyltransferase involved in cell wall biosynthesis
MNAPVPRAKAQQGLRIGYVFSQFPVLTEAFAVSDIAALVGQGHDVSVFTMKPRRRGDRRLREVAGVPDGLPVRAPTFAGALRWPSLVWRYRRVAVQLAGAAIRALPRSPSTAALAFLCIPRALEIADDARRSGLDVVHIFWSRQGGMVLPALQSDGASCVRSAFVGAYDLVADDFLVGLTLRSANVVFSHAEANRGFAQARAGDSVPVRIIRRGIPLLRTLPEQRDPFAWITASALTQTKNVEAILRAFAKAREQDGRVKLTICGDGPDRERLEGLARQLGIGSPVEFAGHVPRDELYQRLNRAALFILLSKKPSERLPNVLKEAL